MTKFLRGTLVIYTICSLTAMAPMNLSFMLVLFAFILSVFLKKFPQASLLTSPDFKTYRFWALSLLFACWGSLLVTKFYPFAYAGHDPEVTIHGFLKIWYLLVPAILVFAFESGASDCEKFSIVTLIKPWWITTFLMMIVAIIQFFTGWPLAQPIPTNPGNFHAILFLGHHLSTSSIFIFPAFTALAVAMGFYSRKNKASQPLSPRFAMIIGMAGTLILFLSYARTAWIALLIGFALLLKKYLFPNLTRKQWLSTAAGIIIALGLFSQTPLVKDRIEKMMGVSERFELWKANIDFFTHRPITGIGWLKTQEMSEFYFKSIDPEHYRNHFWGHAHSNFFEMLGGTGLIGLFVFLGWSIFTLRFAHRLTTRFELSGEYFYSDFARGIFIALILLHFNGLTNVTFWEGKVMHQQMLAVGMLLILSRKKSHSS
jgi:O-antigen ligase